MKSHQFLIIIVVLFSIVLMSGCCSFSGSAHPEPVTTSSTTPTPKPTSSATPAPAGFAKSNPASIGDTVHYTDTYGGSDYEAELTITEVVRGAPATKMMQDANMFNGVPSDDNMEWFLLKVTFHLISYVKDTEFYVSTNDFNTISNNEKLSGFIGAIEPSPEFSGSIYGGATKTGWVAMGAYKDDPRPYIIYKKGYGSDGGVWFRAS